MSRTSLRTDRLKVLLLPGFFVSVLVSYGPSPAHVLESLPWRAERVQDIGRLSPHAVDALRRIPRTGSTSLLVSHPYRGPCEFGLPSDAELDALRELERERLIAFDHPVDAFLARLKSTGRLRERDPRAHPWERVWIELPSAAAGLAPSLERETYRLTAAGRRALQAILSAAPTQLARSN